MSALLTPVVPRCEHSGHPCGTDTMAFGASCGCATCCTFFESQVFDEMGAAEEAQKERIETSIEEERCG